MKSWPLSRLLSFLLATGVACHAAGPRTAQRNTNDLSAFAARIDSIRVQLQIPGLSAAVMQGDTVIWEAAYGLADVASQTPVTTDTRFHLASLTKPFASTIIMQLVEQGIVSLDDSVGKYGITFPGTEVIRVRHLLSHTSEGLPDQAYKYNGNRFAQLDRVILGATGETFAQRVYSRIIVPLGLKNTAPNPQHAAFTVTGKDAATFTAGMATGYGLDAQRKAVRVSYPVSFSSAAGLVSTPRDVARHSVALDAGQFLLHAIRELAYTPATGSDGRALPYGLGWFISNVAGEKLVWHYGYWTGNSSLIIKVPSRRLTFVVLTNSDQLSAPFGLGAGDLMRSPIAQAFVRTFVAGK